MLFEGSIELKTFHDRYGGQRSHGICTPRNKPYIYLIYSPNSSHRQYGNIDNIEYDGVHAPESLHFALEGKTGDKRGNYAVIHHADNQEGIYKSLLLFYLNDGLISCIGEYRYVRIETTNEGDEYFYLERITDLDEVEVNIVAPSSDDENKLVLEKIKSRADYNYLDPDLNESINSNIDGEIARKHDLYAFIDKDGNEININDNTDEARKAQQYLDIIRGYHKELRRNNYTYDDKTHSLKGPEYRPKLTPAFRPKDIQFYVVNIGWGLCQILSFKAKDKIEVWVFDCGGNAKKYKKNLKKCLSDIYGKKPYRIDKLFISHPHNDHFDKYSLFTMDKDTEIWINPNIFFCTHSYVKFLNRIKSNGCKVVEPIVRPGSKGATINVLHPDGHIALNKKGTRAKWKSPLAYASSRTKRLYDVDENHMNELSPIIQLNIGERTIVITGDVMGNGWEFYIRNASKLSPHCYMHSHHGTTAGYEINITSPRLGRISNESDLFCATEVEFVSLKDGYVKGRNTMYIDSNLSKKVGIRRTDVGDLQYYRYDLITGDIKEV